MTTIRRTLAAAALLLTAACAARNASAPSESRALGATDEIVRAQFENKYNTAYEAVRALRRNWLQTRYSPNAVLLPLLAFQDGQRLGTAETLGGINAKTIWYIHFYSGAVATTKFGMEAGGGVIYVSTTDRRP